MSKAANWSFTAKATFWKSLGSDEWGKKIYASPVIIMGDYGGDISRVRNNVGNELVIKNTFWTEFSEAKAGDYLLIGESSTENPLEAGADEVVHIVRYADTFDRLADDYVIITG